MSASFTSASSQRLLNTVAPVTTMPLSIGMWVNPTVDATQVIASVCASANSNHYYEMRMVSGLFLQIASAAGASAGSTSVSGITLGQWYYFVARFISSTSRRMSVLYSNGSISHAVNTTDRTPTVTRMALGARDASTASLFFDGSVAEFWVANVDIQPDGAQTQDALVRQLAYGGPFSVPDVRDNIVSYRSFRSSLGSDQDKPNEVWSPAPQTWTNTNGVTLGPHPPLPYWRGSPKTAIRGAVPI